MFELMGQTALVTGAATGIGEAIAQRLTAAGARVAVADIDLESARAAAKRIGGNAFAVCLDVTRTEQVNAAIENVLATAGSLEILVNNAGLAGRAAPIWEQTDDDWHRVLGVNIHGPFYLCRAVLPTMRAKGYGRIVNVASIAGKEGNPNMVAYSASKAAVIGLTKAIAKEVATEGICINAVAPAVIRTKILDQLTQAQVEYMVQKIPMRRTGNAEEVAAVVHFLASRDCSFVTGQCYDVSGGRGTY
ncbi:MAG TPA: SDR family NAD(P)-dependent oxidoreductase [Terracidiphilus sp.]|nr:SDR family NAD(P)-dependent oxidoreductase [Terracidiphilus sp.]